MRWRAYFYLHPEIQRESKENYGFNSKGIDYKTSDLFLTAVADLA